MKTIYKYILALEDEQTLDLPSDFKILKIGIQPCSMLSMATQIYIWASVDTDSPIVQKTFYIFGTAACFEEDNCEYLDTVMDESFVWHVFMEKENEN